MKTNPECIHCGLLKSTCDGTGVLCTTRQHQFGELTPSPVEGWEEEFVKLIHGSHGNGELIERDEFFYKIDSMKSFIHSAISKAVGEERERAAKITEYIETPLAVIDGPLDYSKGFEVGYRSGYKAALTNVASHIRNNN